MDIFMMDIDAAIAQPNANAGWIANEKVSFLISATFLERRAEEKGWG